MKKIRPVNECNFHLLMKTFKVKRITLYLLLFTLLHTLAYSTYAQRSISGTVTDQAGEPMIGVTVAVRGTTVGTITDIGGNYTISDIADGATLTFSFVGMVTQEIPITDQTEINITLQPDVIGLEEVVVVGYGRQKKESVVGAIATTSEEELKTQGKITNMTDALLGVMPGVTILQGSGMPGAYGTSSEADRGYENSEILIRGRSTWNNASPLILVDGVEREMNDIDISEVENISVLKDASATAVFGVKGGNGLILITTKKGRVGKAKLTFEAEQSFESKSKMVRLLPPSEAAPYLNSAIERTRRINNTAWYPYYVSEEEIGYYRSGEYPYAYQNLSWADFMYKDWSSSHRFNASLSGGNDNMKYFGTVAYNHEGDIMNSKDLGNGYDPGFSYNRLNIRTNFDFKLTETTDLAANIAGYYGISAGPRTGSGSTGKLYAIRLPGNSPIAVYEDGTPGVSLEAETGSNPYRMLNYTGVDTWPRSFLNMDYTLNQKLDFITKGLSLSGKLAYDNYFANNGARITDNSHIPKEIDKEFYVLGGYYDYETETYMLDGEPANMADWTQYSQAGTTIYGVEKQPNNYGTEEVDAGSARRDLYYQVKIDYAREFAGVHNITAMAMFSRTKQETGSGWPRKREDWVGRITYDYDSRYLLEVNGAYNGSEKFGPDYRFDLFPSVAGGWILTNEDFMKSIMGNWLSTFKIRYSYGLVGNDRVSTGSIWPYLTLWDNNAYEAHPVGQVAFGYPSFYTGLTHYGEGAPGNPAQRWETATKQNLGVEIVLFNRRLQMNADIFKEDRRDMLLGADERSTNLPPLFGQSPPAANVGEAKSHGAEFEFTYKDRISDFQYWISYNWSMARSEVIYQETPELTPAQRAPEGKPIGQTIVQMRTGFIESWDDLYCITGSYNASYNRQTMPGDVAVLDFNADGEIYQDQAPWYYPTYPQNNYGISFGANYKGFSFSTRFIGAYNTMRSLGLNLFFEDLMVIPEYVANTTWSQEFNNENPAYYAVALPSGKRSEGANINHFDGSYFRLQSIQLGYTLPGKWTKPLRMDRLTFYVNGRNLFLWTKAPNDAIGMNVDRRNYPTKKQVNMGIRLAF